MKVPLSWLTEYVTLPYSTDEIAKTLVLAGIEVDAIEFTGGSFSGVVTGEVIESSPHPNADRLTVAKVSDGNEIFQVVCGASNCRPGIKVAFAKIGACLQDEKGSFKIKKGKLRDVESFGMLCSASELGMGASSEGILELPKDTPLGIDVSSLYGDTIFSLSLTPNLGHCMSVYGIARELAAFFQIPLKPILVDRVTETGKPGIEPFVEDKNLCPYYRSKEVRSVVVGPSSDALKEKIELSGLRSINNVVDIANYVMLATGQPLHFFDLNEIKGSSIFISPCDKDSSVVTLDGSAKTIPQGTTVIRDEEKILAVGGIIGCLQGSVTEKTTDILIEAAVFDPASIRRASKALSLKTDASARFERGVDPGALATALELAAKLLVKEAKASSVSVDFTGAMPPVPVKKIVCRTKKVRDLLGVSLSTGEISELLAQLQIVTESEQEGSITLLVPSYRNDIKEEIDLVEEVARLYGFNNLPKSRGRHISSILPDEPVFLCENKARNLLLQEGLQEMLTCDLISPSSAEVAGEREDPGIELITVLQSKSADYSVMRPSLLPGLLTALKHNLDRQNKTVAGFEVGRIHFKQDGNFTERPSIAVILSGLSTPYHHDPKPREVDFFDLKGIVENLLESFSLPKVEFEVSHLKTFQSGRQAKVFSKKTFLGVIGEIHPFTLQKLDISGRVYCAELDLQMIESLKSNAISVKPLPLYPSSERDWTISVSKETKVGDILSDIRRSAPALLENVFLIGVFENEKIGTDRKNVTFRFSYRDTEKTIDSATVETIHTNLLQKVAQKLGNCIL